jgi:hypothetical protein
MHETSVISSIERAEFEAKVLKKAKLFKHIIFDEHGEASLEKVP